jgi:ribonuclease BN (tRNA processing enzyme)
MREVELDLGGYIPVQPVPGVGRWRYEKKLPLTTSGHLRVLALGVGSAFSTRMYQSNFIIIKGQTALFADFGSMVTLRMAEFGLTCHDVKDLLITHSHSDHIGSLEELALRRRYEAPFMENARGANESGEQYQQRVRELRQEGRYRPNLYVPESYARDLWEMSLRGGLAFSEEVELDGPTGGMVLDHFFNLIPPHFDESSLTWVSQIGGIKVRSFLTKHVPDTAADSGMYTSGMIIDDRLFISGDTKFDPSIVEKYGQDCEVLWHDAQHASGGVHAFYGDLKTLPADIRSRMWLYHISDGLVGFDVKGDGFAGLVKSGPMVYEFD